MKVKSFILQDENPSRERTIVRTAEKLKPFCFNKFLENGYHDFLPSRLRHKFQNVKVSDAGDPSEDLCPICGSPLSESDLQNMKSHWGKSLTRTEVFVGNCCQSCCFQILPKRTASREHFYSLLPRLMTQRAKDRSHDADGSLTQRVKDKSHDADRSWLR